MNRNEQITELFTRSTIQQIITRFTSDQYFQEELKSILFEKLLKLPEKKFTEIYKDNNSGIERYCSKIIKHEFRSSKSGFHKLIRRPRQTEDHIDDSNQEKINEVADESSNHLQLLDQCQIEFKKLSWYDAQIFQYVVDGLTIKEISVKTKIGRDYISEAINRIRTDLKSKIRKNL